MKAPVYARPMQPNALNFESGIPKLAVLELVDICLAQDVNPRCSWAMTAHFSGR